MGYIGNSPEYWNLNVNKYSYTATEGQKVFPAVYDSVVDVYLNGSKLQADIDYTATDGVTVVLIEAALMNDVVDINGYFNMENFDITKYGGSGSGMNADLLDGQHGSYYTPNSQFASHTANTTNPHLVTAAQIGALSSSSIVTSVSSSSTNSQVPSALCMYTAIGNIESLLAGI